jgi:hypothetical protein
VQGDGQLDAPEVRAQVATGLGDGGDQGVADLARQRGQLVGGKGAEVLGTLERS